MNIISFYTDNLNEKLENTIKKFSNEIIKLTINHFSVPFYINNYFAYISDIERKIRELGILIISTTFEELDEQFKNSHERLERYVVNKSNVERTIITVFGALTYKRTYYKSRLDGTSHFLLDEAFSIPQYDHYDPTVKAMAIDNAIRNSQSEAGRNIGERISPLRAMASENRKLYNISRQTIYNWINEWNVPKYVYDQVENTPDSLYIMADEKFIGSQRMDKDIMVKCMVAFEGVENVGKGRRKLINRTICSTYSERPWEAFLTVLNQKYDLSKVKKIYLLSDAGAWIKSGISELRTESKQSIKFLLCQYHFKQAINRITYDKDKRAEILKIFNEKSKDEFVNDTLNIIEEMGIKDEESKQRRINQVNYISNNYKAIKSMLKSDVGSSMESHISHYIASTFASRPKGFSAKKIDKYLRLNDYKNNGLNLFNIYAQTYDKMEEIEINNSNINYSMFEKKNALSVITKGENTGLYKKLIATAHGNSYNLF